MQYQPLQWLWAVRDTEFDNPLERLLAYQMLAHADANGECFPSVDRLSNALGVGRTQTQKLRRQLKERGLIELVKKGHRGHASTYKLTLKALTKALTPTPNKALTPSEHQEGHEEIHQQQEDSAQSFALAGDDDGSEVGADSAAPPNGDGQTSSLTSPALEDEGRDISDARCEYGGVYSASGSDFCIYCGVHSAEHPRVEGWYDGTRVNTAA